VSPVPNDAASAGGAPRGPAPRVAVIGLDAADFGFLDAWLAEGDLPNLARILGEGVRSPLRSTLPPVSAPAWASFMTGVGPGGHGLYDFVVEDPRTDRPVLARADLVRRPFLWETAAAQGRRPVVVNVPVTWPPRAFDGLLVTGMLTPEGSKQFTHPPYLAEEILREFPGYRCDLEIGLKEDREALRTHLDAMAGETAALMRSLLKRGPWDLFVGVFTTTDRAKHLFWDERETVVRRHYRAVDAELGKLLGDAGGDALVIVLSDHGFHGVRTKFYLNRWLRERGWLEVREAAAGPATGATGDAEDLARGAEFLASAKRRRGLLARLLGTAGEPEALEIDRARSRAWLSSVWTGGVRINLEGRNPQGIVTKAEYEPFRDVLIAGLATLVHPETGGPLFDWVGRREDVYRGPMLEWAPDVVTRSEGLRVHIGKNLDRGRLTRVSKHDTGTHSDVGILGLHGPCVRRGAAFTAPPSLEDVLPTALWALGCALPSDLDGRVLVEAFDPAVVAAHPVRVLADGTAAGPGVAQAGYDADEEEQLRRTLEGLGYL
jgi:predicted AlkP superfamily phosphohydrolase/phosphomutase